MKQILIALCILNFNGTAQTLKLSTGQTTSLIFPYAIRHVDRGTKEVLVQPVKEADNILLVKAAVTGFTATNLSVVTSDGSTYSFPVVYCPNPAQWIYHIPIQHNAAIETYAKGILDNPKTMHGMKDRAWDMSSRVAGIYIRNNVIYYQLEIKNDGPIDFDIDFMRFYIRDKNTRRRTAIQENELVPFFVAGNTAMVPANSTDVIVVALEKFTIPDAKWLAIELNEKNGGRHLLMRVSNRKIIKAKMPPDLK